jgi:hypothetical protein
VGVCIGGRTTPPSSYLFPEYGLGNRNTTINIVFLFFLFFVLRVTTKPSEEVDATLPTSLVSLARDPRLVLREILCWEDKNAYTEHVKGEDSLYFCGLVYFLTYFFLYRRSWLSALSREENLSKSAAPAISIFLSFYRKYGFTRLGGSWSSHFDRLSASYSNSDIKLYTP